MVPSQQGHPVFYLAGAFKQVAVSGGGFEGGGFPNPPYGRSGCGTCRGQTLSTSHYIRIVIGEGLWATDIKRIHATEVHRGRLAVGLVSLGP